MRQKFSQTGNGMIRDAGEDIFQPDERIDADALTGSHETPQHRGGLPAFVAPKENPVVATYGYAADRARTARPSGLFGNTSAWISNK